MKKQKLFNAAVQAMDNYTRAVEMDLPDFANYYECQMKDFLREIKQRGFSEEFEEFAIVI